MLVERTLRIKFVLIVKLVRAAEVQVEIGKMKFD